MQLSCCSKCGGVLQEGQSCSCLKFYIASKDDFDFEKSVPIPENQLESTLDSCFHELWEVEFSYTFVLLAQKYAKALWELESFTEDLELVIYDPRSKTYARTHVEFEGVEPVFFAKVVKKVRG